MHRSGSDQWIRGGQATQHWFRMGMQVIKTTIQVGAAVFFLSYAGLCFYHFNMDGVHASYAHLLATFLVESRGVPEAIVRFKHPDDGWIDLTAALVYNDPGIAAVSHLYETQAVVFAWWSIPPALFGAFCTAAIFMFSGKRLEGDSHVRGTMLVEASELKKWVNAKWKAYRKQFGKNFKSGPMYTIGGIPFPPNAVEAQTAISGTVGSGKTNAIKEMLITIRESGGRTIIYDRTGAYVRDFYDPRTDIIVNPFDSRSVCWSPFFEANSKEFFTQMSEVLIPDRPGTSDPFWTQAARIVFDYAAATLYETDNPTNKDLREAILQIPSKQLSLLIQNTPGRHFFNEDITKTADSIRANLIAELRFLEFLRDDGQPFSIRDWVFNADKGFVFLTGDPEHAAATRNIISTVFEVAANALMTCKESNDPRIWFVIDELPALNRLPFLPTSIAQIRQFGGAFLVGFQSVSQLEDVYGDKAAKTITANLNNRVVFNTPDHDTAELFSKSLGSEDVLENRDSISVGAHETRDGIGIMSQRTERRIVTASQIQSLPQFEGYLRFAYDAPTAFVKFDAVNTEPVAEKFIKYHGRGFGNGDMSGPPTPPPMPSDDNANEISDIGMLFTRYRARLVNSGLEIYAEDKHRDALWAHFYEHHAKGTPLDEIGPPTEKVTRLPLMNGKPPKPRPTPEPGEVVPFLSQDQSHPEHLEQPIQPTLFDASDDLDPPCAATPASNLAHDIRKPSQVQSANVASSLFDEVSANLTDLRPGR